MSIYDYKVKKRDGSELGLASLKGKVLLIVNTATGCGFTPQYEGLEKLYSAYHDKGFEILDFPCNQFGHQAPGDNDEIHEFCTAKYKTTFDQLAKLEVNGDKADPLWVYLKGEITEDTEPKGLKNKMAMKAIEKMPGVGKEPGFIKWNFTKFLVDRNGKVVGRFGPTDKPEEFEDKIKELL
ncbi:glutathione peroxidase [Candidatus Saccharibacteria bacterium]|nr:glutathione peroxidase [Candidatus Saccharibacteria bacterium]MBQ3292691.1 glutathione peroxidase [Candidatus Saccharibacteria bacterium]MBQ3476204.1 glutathione peroxidase [Candidatus Saccharibacteria bacterium]